MLRYKGWTGDLEITVECGCYTEFTCHYREDYFSPPYYEYALDIIPCEKHREKLDTHSSDETFINFLGDAILDHLCNINLCSEEELFSENDEADLSTKEWEELIGYAIQEAKAKKPAKK